MSFAANKSSTDGLAISSICSTRVRRHSETSNIFKGDDHHARFASQMAMIIQHVDDLFRSPQNWILRRRPQCPVTVRAHNSPPTSKARAFLLVLRKFTLKVTKRSQVRHRGFPSESGTNKASMTQWQSSGNQPVHRTKIFAHLNPSYRIVGVFQLLHSLAEDRTLRRRILQYFFPFPPSTLRSLPILVMVG